jgi:NitT/TauT family transport system substrate-binding protein
MTAMLGGHSEVDAHFGSSPYQDMELKDPKVHRVLNSYDVFGGPHTFNVVWASAKLYEGEPKVVKAFLAALEQAIKYIKSDPDGAAALWVKNTHSKLPVEEVARIVKLPENEWTMTPKKTMVFAEYMSRVGMIPVKPTSWKDYYIDAIHNLPGS